MVGTVLILLLQGCFHCGSFDVSGTTVISDDGEAYDGHRYEVCGTIGTWGNWDPEGDGRAVIYFTPTAHGSRFLQVADFAVSASVPDTLLVPDTTIDLDQIGGAAFISPEVSQMKDLVGLTQGTIDVLSGYEGEDPCAESEGPTWRLRWSLLFGDGTGPTWDLEGTDKVQFSTFLDSECDSGA